MKLVRNFDNRSFVPCFLWIAFFMEIVDRNFPHDSIEVSKNLMFDFIVVAIDKLYSTAKFSIYGINFTM